MKLRARFFCRWYDLWVGLYWDRINRVLYFCPLPMLGVMLFLERRGVQEFIGGDVCPPPQAPLGGDDKTLSFINPGPPPGWGRGRR